jgi:hypothetical protein
MNQKVMALEASLDRARQALLRELNMPEEPGGRYFTDTNSTFKVWAQNGQILTIFLSIPYDVLTSPDGTVVLGRSG